MREGVAKIGISISDGRAVKYIRQIKRPYSLFAHLSISKFIDDFFAYEGRLFILVFRGAPFNRNAHERRLGTLERFENRIEFEHGIVGKFVCRYCPFSKVSDTV